MAEIILTGDALEQLRHLPPESVHTCVTSPPYYNLRDYGAAGQIVLNPATAPEGLRPVDYMRLCFAMMEAADVVLFMQDYQDSRGAMLEWAWCQYVGKQTCFDLAAFGGAKTE